MVFFVSHFTIYAQSTEGTVNFLTYSTENFKEIYKPVKFLTQNENTVTTKYRLLSLVCDNNRHFRTESPYTLPYINFNIPDI
jgi:hypothetical protein